MCIVVEPIMITDATGWKAVDQRGLAPESICSHTYMRYRNQQQVGVVAEASVATAMIAVAGGASAVVCAGQSRRRMWSCSSQRGSPRSKALE